MDLTLVFAGLSGLIIIVLIVFLLKQRSSKKPGGARLPQPHGRPVEGNLPRRAMAVRNARARLRAAAGGAAAEEDNNEAGGEAHVDDVEIDGKVGAKKRAKLEAKAERKHQREIDEREREDKKRKLELDEEERAKLSEKERLEEEKRAEEEKMAKEEKERQEQKEYLRMKAAFSVEEEGYDENDLESEEGNLLQEFIMYIKNNKVVVLEDIAAHFKLKTQNVIDRIQDLQTEGILTGVVDDRGKFIYIPREELEAVAKFVKRCGRVSLSELAENSNKLINLNPAITT